MQIRVTLLLTLCLALPSGLAVAQTITRAQAAQIMAQCQAERQKMLEPVRAEEVERCLARRMHSREECERRATTFGERSNVGAATGLFWDTPTCQQAIELDQYFKMYPGRQTWPEDTWTDN